MIDLTNPVLLGPVQNQEHYMQGVVARRNNFAEPILDFLEEAYEDFGELTGRHYGLVTQYKSDDADTVFVSLGSAAENIEAAVDYLRETRKAQGRLDSRQRHSARSPRRRSSTRSRARRTSSSSSAPTKPLAGDNPMGRDIRTALAQGAAGRRTGMPADHAGRRCRASSAACYGLGSRDFRPEHTIGAYEFAIGKRARKDGKTRGRRRLLLRARRRSSLRSDRRTKRRRCCPKAQSPSASTPSAAGAPSRPARTSARSSATSTICSTSATRSSTSSAIRRKSSTSAPIPKYGSEKKGAPTCYFMVAAPERIRVNCDLRHVNVVLCCDPKAFTHTNPLDGMQEGGCLVWESDEEGEQRVGAPPDLGAQADHREEDPRLHAARLRDRAQGDRPRRPAAAHAGQRVPRRVLRRLAAARRNSASRQEQFRDVVHKQYVKKFGQLGEAVVNSNMEVMTQGFERVQEIEIGELAAADRSTLRGQALLPILEMADSRPAKAAAPAAAAPHRLPRARPRVRRSRRIAAFDAEFRASFGYDQPATPSRAWASWPRAAATRRRSTSRAAKRRSTFAENCTQCMECIAVCPDTALPNCSQDLDTVLRTAVTHYVTDAGERQKMLQLAAGDREAHARADARRGREERQARRCQEIIREVTNAVDGFSPEAKTQFFDIIDKVPMAYQKTNAIFATPEKKTPGARRHLLHLRLATSARAARPASRPAAITRRCRWCRKPKRSTPSTKPAPRSSTCCPTRRRSTSASTTTRDPQDSKTATLRNMLMVRRNYDALVSGDGACAGCGEKSILRAIAAVTEAYMRPRLPREGRSLPWPRPTSSRRTASQKLAALKAAKPGGVRALPPGRRAPDHGPRRRGRQGHQGAHRATSTARSPTRRSSMRSPPSCGRRRSTTRTCRRSTAASPTACPSWPWPRTPAATPSTARRRRTIRIRIPG